MTLLGFVLHFSSAYVNGHAIRVIIAQGFTFGNVIDADDGVISIFSPYNRLGAEEARSVTHHSIDVGYDMPKHLCLRS